MSITTEIQRLQQAKTDIKTAIEEKGVEVGDGTIDTFASKISEITGGGGSGGIPTGYKTVTFMNGDEFLFERLVLSGDNCPDPVTQGRIETPTKESTVDKVFTYSGWTSVDGGTVDSSILNNITEDTVVYSAFAESVRYYTITYYDDDGTTVLNTEQVAYGQMPSYIPTKSGYVLESWIPEITNVVEDMSYVAIWRAKAKLNDYTWEEIIAFNEQGIAQDMFEVGDMKEIVCAYDGITFENTWGSITKEQYSVKLIGFNHDELSDGSGKAAMTFMWNGSSMPLNYETSFGSGKNNYAESLIHSDLNSNLTLGDTALANAVKTVKKEYVVDLSTKETSALDCKFWVLSPTELGYTLPNLPIEGKKYELFSGKTDMNMKEAEYTAINIGKTRTLLRTLYDTADNCYVMVSNTKLSYSTAGKLRFCFCI